MAEESNDIRVARVQYFHQSAYVWTNSLLSMTPQMVYNNASITVLAAFACASLIPYIIAAPVHLLWDGVGARGRRNQIKPINKLVLSVLYSFEVCLKSEMLYRSTIPTICLAYFSSEIVYVEFVSAIEFAL